LATIQSYTLPLPKERGSYPVENETRWKKCLASTTCSLSCYDVNFKFSTRLYSTQVSKNIADSLLLNARKYGGKISTRDT